jgi:ATP-dependent Clp protease ATP-binding subunit ClpB
VILFDEVEKAHPDVFNILLQLLDDGRLTDAQGRTVDFKNTVVIMTSNIGSHHLLEGVSALGEIDERARTAVLGELRAHFRPEFLNRVDDIVLFTPLSLPQIERIVDLLTADLGRRLEDRGVRLELTAPARTFIAREAYDPVYGARPLKRWLQRHLETRIARALLSGEAADGAVVKVALEGGALDIRVEAPVVAG